MTNTPANKMNRDWVPGCLQGVRWFVLENPVEASQAQIDRFIEDLTEGGTNNRLIQKTHGRAILKGK